MSENVTFKYQKLQPYKEIAYCRTCNIPIENSGTGITNAVGTSVRHTCKDCKKEYYLDKFYPRKVFIEEEGILYDKPKSV